MSKKDYILIAEVLRRANYQAMQGSYNGSIKEPSVNTLIQETITCIIGDMAEALENNNPKFNKAKFWEACE